MSKSALSRIDLNLAEELNDSEFRHEFFRTLSQDEVAEKIRGLRKYRRFNQAELAQKCGMKQSAISRIEQSSYSGWSFNTLWRLAKALDVRIRIQFELMEQAIGQFQPSPLDAVSSTSTHVHSAEVPASIATEVFRPAGIEMETGTMQEEKVGRDESDRANDALILVLRG